MLGAATCLGRVLLGPARLLQAFEQALSLLGVELLSKRLTANILARDLVLAVALDPSQGAACFPVAIARSDLSQDRARMWPKKISPKPDGSGHELLVDGPGLQGAGYNQMVCGVNAPSTSSEGNRTKAVNALCNSGSTSAASFVNGR